jgi:hypothetical protein
MADRSLGRFGSVLDLGVNLIWLQSVPKISIERFAELLEDYSFAELLEDCLQVIGVFPSGLSSLVGARRPVCPFVLGWRLLLFHGQFCQNPTQREWAIPVGDPSGEAYSVPSAITLSISLASFLKWTEALVKLALLHSRRASGDLLRIIGFGAQLLCAGLHVLHELYLGGQPGDFSLASQ